MPEKSFLHKMVLNTFQPKIVEEEDYVDQIFLGLFGMFVSLIFLSIFGVVSEISALALRLGMFVSYASLFTFILFTLYYSFPLLDYIDNQIGEKSVTLIIRGFSLLLIGAILFFVWPLLSSLISVTQEVSILIEQSNYVSFLLSFMALFAIIIPNYLSNVIFDNYNFKIEVEKA